MYSRGLGLPRGSVHAASPFGISTEIEVIRSVFQHSSSPETNKPHLKLRAGKKAKKRKKKPQKKGSGAGATTQQHDTVADVEQQGGASIEVALLRSSMSNADPVDGDTPNCDAWRPPAALSVGHEVVPITYNPPTVAGLDVAPRVMPGFPVVASAEVLYADVAACEWEWLRVPPAECAPLYLAPVVPVQIGKFRFFRTTFWVSLGDK